MQHKENVKLNIILMKFYTTTKNLTEIYEQTILYIQDGNN